MCAFLGVCQGLNSLICRLGIFQIAFSQALTRKVIFKNIQRAKTYYGLLQLPLLSSELLKSFSIHLLNTA